MSAAAAIASDPLQLLTVDDIAVLFQCPSEGIRARRAWTISRLRRLGLWEEGVRDARFSRAVVEAALKKRGGCV